MTLSRSEGDDISTEYEQNERMSMRNCGKRMWKRVVKVASALALHFTNTARLPYQLNPYQLLFSTQINLTFNSNF